MNQWVFKDLPAVDVLKNLEKWPKMVRQFLFLRGIEREEDADKFLNPDYNRDLIDPFRILNMDKAVERISRAIKDNERVIIYGDYDADGVCALAIFYSFFKKVGFENFHIHIPDRNLDGYGLSLNAINEFAKQKAGLIITFDCGITSCDEVDEANSMGIDVIITDHHLVPIDKETGRERLPKAFAVLDSKQSSDNYPFKHLCGAGLSFKIVQALIKIGSTGAEGENLWKIMPGWEKWLLDLVAIATVADMVPLVGENRVLTRYGLMVLKKTRRQGLLALSKIFKVDLPNITEDDISFMIAPRVNIASRMAHANTSFFLLTTESQEEANWTAKQLGEMYDEQKNIVAGILEEIEKTIAKEKIGFSVIVEGNESWRPGVLGIVANKLLDKYGVPVFLWGKAGAKETKGSCRAPKNLKIDLTKLMAEVSDEILTNFGGHALSGGFSLSGGKESVFKDEIIKTCGNFSESDLEKKALQIDSELKIDDVNWDNYSMIEKLQPFGVENSKPVFLFSDLGIDSIKKFGNGGIHLELCFKKLACAGGSDNKIIKAIGFFMRDDGFENMKLEAGQKIDLVANIEKSTFRNFPELRLRIVDIKIR